MAFTKGGHEITATQKHRRHICGTIFLQAEALDLKVGIVGAYHDEKLCGIMNLPKTHEPLLVMPVGHPNDA